MSFSKESPSPLELIEGLINTFNHMLIAIVTICVVWVYLTIPYKLYVFHPICGVLAYHFFMSEAILVLYHRNSWTRELSRNAKRWIHAILMQLASISALTGVGIEIYVKSGVILWNSNHVFLGLTASMLLILNVILGILTFYSAKPAIRRFFHPLYLKFFHNIIGISCFVIGMTTLFFAYKRDFMQVDYVSDAVRNGLSTATITSASITAFGAFQTLYSQFTGILKLQKRSRK